MWDFINEIDFDVIIQIFTAVSAGIIVATIIYLANKFSVWFSAKKRFARSGQDHVITSSDRAHIMRYVNQLDKYVLDCVKIALDHGYPRVIEHPLGINITPIQEPIEEEPPLPEHFSDDIDWTVIGDDLMSRIFTLPEKAKEAAKEVKSERERWKPIYFVEYFKKRQLQYAQLGIEAHEITKELRRIYTIRERVTKEWKGERLESILQDRIDGRDLLQLKLEP